VPRVEPSKVPLTVGDVFCGAGGFSEGFAQAGFEIKWGVDFWGPAAETFRKNHPEAEVFQADALTLSPDTLPRVDVLLGSPPCVHFSPANKGGGGNREKGMELVRRFLEFVDRLKPTYWVMENVPAMLTDLEAEMNGDEFELESRNLLIPTRTVLDSSDYATPQSRRRLFSGSFPIPTAGEAPSGQSVVPLRRIIEAFPAPDRREVAATTRIRDPVYPGVELLVPKLRDHFEDTRWTLSLAEINRSRFWKQSNPVYGRMAFPDSLDRPSRTITSTRTRGSRSTIVIPYDSAHGPTMRTLTLRECASVQGFPITYQFWGSSVSDKDFLVGNAVVPPVARAIAHAILRDKALPVPRTPIVGKIGELPPLVTVRPTGPRHFSIRRRFRGMVQIDIRHDHRLELDNGLDERIRKALGRLPPDAMPPINWQSRLYLGYAVLYKSYDIRLLDALRLSQSLVKGPSGIVEQSQMNSLLLSTVQITANGFPDGMTLQSEWAGLATQKFGPRWLLATTAREVGKAFPSGAWSGKFIPVEVSSPVLSDCRIASQGKDAPLSQPVPVSVRLAVSAICLSLMCEALNSGATRLQQLLAGLMSPRGIRSARVDRLIQSLARTGSGPRHRQTSFIVR
jgi:DNA (cytosine-5)-methyltransferase 1